LLGRLNGIQTTCLNWQTPEAATFDHGLLGLCTSLGELAAVCGEVDGYLGYDSCGQHLANAAGIPAVTVFTGHPHSRFLDRWSPWSRRNLTTVIPVELDPAGLAPLTALIDRALLALNHLIGQRQN